MTALLVLVLLAPQESAARLKAGQEKIKIRDFDGAIPEFEKCLKLAPEEFNASFGLGICMWEKEEYKTSRAHFRRVVEVVERQTPGAALTTVHQKLLGCALFLEDFDEAIAEATLLLKTQERAEYYYDRALARHRKGDLNGALEDCAAAVREDAQMAKARTLRAFIVLARGDTATALGEFDEARKAKPSDPSIPFSRGCALLLLGRDPEARGQFRESLKANQGQSSDLELRAVSLALIWVCERPGGGPAAAAEELRVYQAELQELGRDPKKNHLLCLPLYLGGAVPEADLLKAAEGAVCRPAQARCEAWLFIAERKRLGGDLAGARAAYTSGIQTGARGVFEHDLAERRLKELPE
ncbi:MAG TPA: tetratricopeptide repeat protein [Planctomycetota bacterium]|nr:tetratricopeptide repeat protein [Planctomycetota bacterium]